MQYSDLLKTINKTAMYRVKDLEFLVQVTDAKTAYGATRYLIRPENGTGLMWVNDTSVKLIEGTGV